MQPNEELARRIAGKLAESRLIGAREAEALAARLAKGELKARDWEALLLEERDADA